MTADERVISYINSLGVQNNDFLEALYDRAAKDRVPVIRREVISFIKTVLKMIMPESILEIGTAVGFSSLLMAFNTEPCCHITTLESEPEMIKAARENIASAGMEDRINIIPGDANITLAEISDRYDLVFMDAAKAQYISFLPEVKRLMKEGAVLLSDNIFHDGEIIESRFLVERRDRTIHKRMREYLYAIKHDPELCTSLIPLGDGLAFSVKRT